jgi:hypothetical protein
MVEKFRDFAENLNLRHRGDSRFLEISPVPPLFLSEDAILGMGKTGLMLGTPGRNESAFGIWRCIEMQHHSKLQAILRSNSH